MTIKQKAREVSGFDEISIEAFDDAITSQDETEELVIEADDALLPKLKCEAHTGHLELGLSHWYDFIFVAAENWDCRQALVPISGSGQTQLRVQERLDVHISGSDHVRYHDQSTIEQHISGSGNIQRL